MTIGRALALAAAAAAAVVPLAWMASYASVEGGAGAGVALVSLRVPAVAAFVATLAVALAMASTRAPSLVDLARRADHVLLQDQRLSTSLEVQLLGGTGSLVARLLVDDAERRAAALDWSSVGRMPWSRSSWLLLTAVFVVSLAAATVPVPARVGRVAGGATTPVVDVDRAVRDAETVRRFAELLGAVSQSEDSPYLQAVATSFAELAERISEGTIDAAEASRTLEELVGHLGAASREVSPAFADAVSAAFANAGGGDRPAAPSGASGGADAADADQESDTTQVDAGAVPPVDPSSSSSDASLYLALEDLAGEMANDAGGLGLRAQRPQALDPLSEDIFYGGVLNAETDPNAPPAEPSGFRAQAEGAGDAVGGAQQSSERAGDAIGGGSAELGGGNSDFLGLDADSVGGGALPWNEREDGRYVEVELVPDAVLGEARAFVRDVADAPFRRADEAASTTRSVGATYRDVVGRYFMPGAVQAGGTP